MVGNVLKTHLLGNLLSVNALFHGSVGVFDGGVTAVFLGSLDSLSHGASIQGVGIGSLDLNSEESGLLGLVNGGGVLLVGSDVELTKGDSLAVELGSLEFLSFLAGKDSSILLGLERSLLGSPFLLRGLGSILAFLGSSISFTPSKFASLLSVSQGSFGSDLCFACVVSKTLSHFHLVNDIVTILFGNFSITDHLGLLGLLNGESSLCSRGLCSCISHS